MLAMVRTPVHPLYQSERERGREREREREREKEGKGEREKERCRKLLFLIGMTGALAPFGYIILDKS
jgi:hypothetical protein